MLKQLGVLLAVCLLSIGIEQLLPFTFPASVIGLLLTLLLLMAKWIRLEQVDDLTNFLLENLPFFFIPVSVRIMDYWDVISANFVAFLVICFVTMALVFGVTAWSVVLTMRWMNGRKK